MARIKDKLSAVEVRTARYKGKVLKLFDGGGLYLHIKPGGKYWRLKYRFGGKEKLLALGIYPEKGLKDAREGRDDARKLLDQGVDPSARRRATRAISTHAAANTLESVGREGWESGTKAPGAPKPTF